MRWKKPRFPRLPGRKKPPKGKVLKQLAHKMRTHRKAVSAARYMARTRRSKKLPPLALVPPHRGIGKKYRHHWWQAAAEAEAAAENEVDAYDDPNFIDPEVD
jgi:hypothetical protein